MDVFRPAYEGALPKLQAAVKASMRAPLLSSPLFALYWCSPFRVMYPYYPNPPRRSNGFFHLSGTASASSHEGSNRGLHARTGAPCSTTGRIGNSVQAFLLEQLRNTAQQQYTPTTASS